MRAVAATGRAPLRRALGDGLGAKQSFGIEKASLEKAGNRGRPRCARRAHRRRPIFVVSQNGRNRKSGSVTRAGVSLGQLVRPLESVGCYVPGGRYPLVSTLLMTVIPAQVAGVKNIRVVSPQPRVEVLAAAGMLGVREFYRVGGAQAIAALAYGTETVPGVDKIVGPGNLYVTAAKKLVSFDCAIDFLAGPTEVVILSDDGTPEFIARGPGGAGRTRPGGVGDFHYHFTPPGEGCGGTGESRLRPK